MKKLYIGIIFTLIVIILLVGYILPKNVSEDSPVTPSPTSAGQSKEVLENQKGYQWAEDNGISDVKQCKNESNAFEQGCINYIQDHVDDALQDMDSRDEF